MVHSPSNNRTEETQNKVKLDTSSKKKKKNIDVRIYMQVWCWVALLVHNIGFKIDFQLQYKHNLKHTNIKVQDSFVNGWLSCGCGLANYKTNWHSSHCNLKNKKYFQSYSLLYSLKGLLILFISPEGLAKIVYGSLTIL